jgi:DNA invertase Pin-like site-specific DNA recombinase
VSQAEIRAAFDDAWSKGIQLSRVSGKGQVQGDGLPRQRTAIKQYAKANGYSIVREFADEGVSGAMEITDRPAFADMLKTLHANGVRTVLVERLDRLARDLMVQEAARSYFKEHGFTLMSVMEPDLMASDLSRIAFR